MLRRFRSAQAERGFSYQSVGATRSDGSLPAGFTIDRTRIKLGKGAADFSKATAAINNLIHLRIGWLEPAPIPTEVRAGDTLVLVARLFGLYWLNAARIVYVVDETIGDVSRYGFAYGTLPAHSEMGEELFAVEWNRADDSVWYNILAFSRPRLLLARLAKPIARRVQKQFANDSAAAMRRAAQIQAR
jgi:uncharacterized protein (UPF0548 family)